MVNDLNHFSEIIGQDEAVDFLQNALNRNKVSHAYLFLGPEGVGKMKSALTFAQVLINNTDKEAHIFWQEGIHPDLMIIEIREDKNIIIKEQITEEMEPWLSLKPYRAKHKIVIIRDSHLISEEAANALLKTLEEPPLYAIIILVADQDKLLETIISRCQVIRFFPVQDDILANYLLNLGASLNLAQDISKLAQGNVALANRFLNDGNILVKWQEARDMVVKLSSRDISQVFVVADLINSDTDLFINMLETILRDILIYKTTSNEDLVIIKENINLANYLNIKETYHLKDTIKNINQLKGYYRRYVNSKLISINIAREIWQAFN